jgi:hypothetical protein
MGSWGKPEKLLGKFKDGPPVGAVNAAEGHDPP